MGRWTCSVTGIVAGFCLFILCGCGRPALDASPHPPPTPLPPASGPATSSESSRAADRLSLRLVPGEFTLGLPPPLDFPEAYYTQPESFHPLYNLAVDPEDVENGWQWAWETFLLLSPEGRPAYLDQIASVTPGWAWGRLDTVLLNAAWGPDVLRPLFQRLLDLPLQDQLPRIWRIAQNPSHPCREQADSLLQAYFPDVRPGRYEDYRLRLNSPPTP